LGIGARLFTGKVSPFPLSILINKFYLYIFLSSNAQIYPKNKQLLSNFWGKKPTKSWL